MPPRGKSSRGKKAAAEMPPPTIVPSRPSPLEPPPVASSSSTDRDRLTAEFQSLFDKGDACKVEVIAARGPAAFSAGAAFDAILVSVSSSRIILS
jgi:hypothetical protein